MYAILSAFGGAKDGVKPDNLNPYRNPKRGMSLGDWFGSMKQAKAEQDARRAHGGS